MNTKILEWCGVLTRASCTGEAQRETHFQENLEMFIELTNSGWLGYFCYPLWDQTNLFIPFLHLYIKTYSFDIVCEITSFSNQICVFMFSPNIQKWPTVKIAVWCSWLGRLCHTPRDRFCPEANSWSFPLSLSQSFPDIFLLSYLIEGNISHLKQTWKRVCLCSVFIPEVLTGTFQVRHHLHWPSVY